MSDNRPEICMKELLEQRQKEGKPLVIIEPNPSSEEVVKALKKMLPEDKQNSVVMMDLSKPASKE